MSDPVSDTVSEIAEPVEPTAAPEIRVLRGNPTDTELAALITVLGSARGGGPAEPGLCEVNQWGMPEDRLRYGLVSWQIVTLLDRTKLRR